LKWSGLEFQVLYYLIIAVGNRPLKMFQLTT